MSAETMQDFDAAAHPGALPWLAAFAALCRFILASYVTE